MATVTAGTDAGDRIEELQRRTDYLYREIQDAIDRHVESLRSVNETEAALAVRYLGDLREQLKTVNRSEIKGVGEQSSEGFRRRAKSKKAKENFLNDLEQVLKPKHLSEKRLKQLLDNRDVIKQKLDDWIAEREREEERIRKYRLQTKFLERSGQLEKCPRFGYSGRKKRRRGDYASCKRKYKDRHDKYCNPNRSKATRAPRTPSRGRKMYPCCRKCCKKSYMGCL